MTAAELQSAAEKARAAANAAAKVASDAKLKADAAKDVPGQARARGLAQSYLELDQAATAAEQAAKDAKAAEASARTHPPSMLDKIKKVPLWVPVAVGGGGLAVLVTWLVKRRR